VTTGGIIAHRRTTRWFQRHSNDEPSEDAFKFCPGQYFWHTRAAIRQAEARAVDQRVHVAEHTLRRHRVPPNVQDEAGGRSDARRKRSVRWCT